MKNIWIYLGAVVAILVLLFVLPVVAQTASITKTWTAPADDVGVVKYDGRWAVVRPDTTTQAAKDAWWAAANVITTMPAPAAAGTTQSVTVSGFGVGTFYFVVRSKDAAGNWSDWSNVSATTILDTAPPKPIIDLR